MVARAMDNCCLEKLILISPRDSWPNKLAIQSSANSKNIIKNVKVYNSLNEAVLNFHYIIATSNRKRFLNKPSLNSFEKLYDNVAINKKTAIIFGPENSGLSNQDLMLADMIFTINLSKTNESLNLSHAVLLMSYKWMEYFILNKTKPKPNIILKNTASKSDFVYFMDFLKSELDKVGFLMPKQKSKSMFENIQSMFLRSSLSKSEIKTLWVMIKKLRK